MKALFTLLIIAGLGVGGFFGYQYLEREGMLPWQDTAPPTDDGPEKPPEEVAPPVAPGGAADTIAKRAAPKVDPIAEMYPIPEFQTLEKITSNWTNIPPRAFPRKVITKEPVKLEIAPGASSTQPVGKEMTALGMENGMMVLAMDSASTARARVPATATNIVDQIAERYEVFKKEQVNRIMAQRESEKKRRTEASSAVASATGSSAQPVVTVAKPTKSPSSDPRFAPMISSIKGGDSAEIEMKNVLSWRWGGKTKWGGQEYDSGLITYTVNTLFGPMDTEAMALIKNNKVQKWVYTGSGDEVP